PRGHEMVGHGLREVVDRFFADELQADRLVLERVDVRCNIAVQLRQRSDLRAPGHEPDLLLEPPPRAPADAKAVDLLDRVLLPTSVTIGQEGHRAPRNATVPIELGLDAKREEEELRLLQELERAAVERDVL